ncbi:MAG: hypothetical protein ACE5I3_00850 [Phycisphaerae bacterium]
MRAQHLPPSLLLWTTVAVLSAGCAQVDVRLTAYLSSSVPFPGPGEENPIGIVVAAPHAQSLLEAEVSAKLAKLLRERDYTLAPPEQAAYLLSCSFSIDPGRTATRMVPVHRPGRTYRTYYYGPYRTYTVRTTTVPGYTRYVPERYTVFTRYLNLSLIKLEPPTQRPEGELNGPPAWECEAYSPGQSTDLRWIVNHLLLAAFDCFGKDTDRQVRVVLPWSDERVERLARGLHAKE